MDMVKDYFKTMEGMDTLETPEGFCIYRVNDVEMFMAHFYAKKGKSFDFFKKVIDLGRSKGVEYITGNIYLNDDNLNCVSRRLKIFLGMGAYVIEADKQRITILKHL